MFNKVLIANRGEIALRILRACRELGIRTVAVHSTADETAMHVRLADESVCIGSAKSESSYLNMGAIMSAAWLTRADAIHPGIGFLSENPAFAKMVQEHGLTFIGPTPEHIQTMGNKITAKRIAGEIGLPLVPGSPEAVNDVKQAASYAAEIGYPVMLKAAAGGGGRGMRMVEKPEQLEAAFTRCRQEALAAFADGSLYIEAFLTNPRHIEIQVIGDGRGQVCHYFERECSVQRRHQKVIEEAPSPALSPQQRHDICQRTVKALSRLHYRGAGTVEYLFDNHQFYFIEMNTRLQVEHPVTEIVTGVDLVHEQLRVAALSELSHNQDEIQLNGAAIEFRINAEDPWLFTPSPGEIEVFHPPGGPGVRVDSAMYTGATVPPYYDSMIAKLICFAKTRRAAIAISDRALMEFAILGIQSNLALHQAILQHPTFQAGRYDIKWLEKQLDANALQPESLSHG